MKRGPCSQFLGDQVLDNVTWKLHCKSQQKWLVLSWLNCLVHTGRKNRGFPALFVVIGVYNALSVG